MIKLKALLTRKNLINALFLLICIAILLIPAVKVFLIRAAMYVGLMRAPVESTTPVNPTANSTEFFVKSANDSLISVDKLKGKVVIINFWATWCPPCRAELPTLAELYRHYKNSQDVVILPIDVDGDLVRSKSFMDTYGYNLPIYKIASQVPAQLSFESIPTTIILNSKSQIVAKHSGAANYADPEFYSFIDRLLK